MSWKKSRLSQLARKYIETCEWKAIFESSARWALLPTTHRDSINNYTRPCLMRYWARVIQGQFQVYCAVAAEYEVLNHLSPRYHANRPEINQVLDLHHSTILTTVYQLPTGPTANSAPRPSVSSWTRLLRPSHSDWNFQGSAGRVECTFHHFGICSRSLSTSEYPSDGHGHLKTPCATDASFGLSIIMLPFLDFATRTSDYSHQLCQKSILIALKMLAAWLAL